MSMQIQFNQKMIQINQIRPLLSELLSSEGIHGDYFAVVVNDQLIPRSSYQAYVINEGDKVDVITPMQGG
ncbi:sulfur carrier protein ThiS [Thiotrichales bacterium 19S3-7]|nr:sulfur carrier protein ThiS [Thiotrichales bacterium 19S3-7]MCF6800648.1 sulfur carrier protein ThiS [Thiotrichales bacterium 19S3-11]